MLSSNLEQLEDKGGGATVGGGEGRREAGRPTVAVARALPSPWRLLLLDISWSDGREARGSA